MVRSSAHDAWVEAVLNVRVAPSGGGQAEFVSLQRARLGWETARKAAREEIASLERVILGFAAGRFFADEVGKNTHRLFSILETLDERLLDALDAALNAEAAPDRAALQRRAADLVAEYQAFIDSDKLALAIDSNPFQRVSVRASLVETLAGLQRQLAVA